MKIAVIGVTGTIGKAVSHLLKEQGHTVIGAARSTQPAINIDEPDSIQSFFEQTRGLNAVVCTAGNASFGALADLSDEQFHLGIRSKLMGQVNLVRRGLPKVEAPCVFILTGGILAYNPWPQTSAISLVNAGLEGFVRGAAQDLGESHRILIVHPPLVNETAVSMGMDPSPWPTAAAVAETYSESLTGNATGIPVFVKGHQP